jgi:two-component system chemotaxis response regulator CheB
MARTVKVLVVDDSLVARQFLKGILTEAGGMEVSMAPDAIVALEHIQRDRPDVVVLDLEMPRMHGLDFLRRVMAERPLPVVVCSGHVGGGTDLAIRALEEGAVGVVAKPRQWGRESMEETAVTLVDTLRAAARAKLERRPQSRSPIAGSTAPTAETAGPVPAGAWGTIVAMGASTGGTDALATILRRLPAETPAIMIVLHMPEKFTTAFAARLDRISAFHVKEAADGDRLVPGLALLAPGGRHLIVRRNGPDFVARVIDGPLVTRHRPSVDVLFHSVARTTGASSVGVLLTGMGEDGAAGLLEMKQAGAATVAQDESTSVVFGMAREAISRGAVEDIAAIEDIAGVVVRRAVEKCGLSLVRK